jgi:hypothetical protein
MLTSAVARGWEALGVPYGGYPEGSEQDECGQWGFVHFYPGLCLL